MLSPRFLALCIAVLAPILALSAQVSAAPDNRTTTSTSLDIVDVTLAAPSDVETCRSSYITWKWDHNGTPPSDPIALSIINASSFGYSNTRRRAARRHFDSAGKSIALAQRATVRGSILPHASSLPFNEVSYLWEQVTVSPGEYRLLLTVVASGSAVVSDPVTVTQGSDTSCLSTASTESASSGISTVSATQSPTGSLTDGPVGDSSGESTDSGTDSGTASGEQPSAPTWVGTNPGEPNASVDTSQGTSSSSADQANQDHSHGSSSNSGAIAAGFIVPLVAVAAAVYAFLRWRKQRGPQGSSNHSAGPRSAWTEKFFNTSSDGGPAASVSASHRRQISGPQLASAAGMAAVAGMVPPELRQEKDEAALRAVPHPNVPTSPEVLDAIYSNSSGDHWIDFADDDIRGARPLSDGTINSRGRCSSQRQTSTDTAGSQLKFNQFYTHGHNIPLRPESPPISFGEDSISSFGNPAGRMSAQSQVSIGRNLIAALPNPPVSAVKGTQGISSSLQRSDSGGSLFGVKRKPVPQWSAAQNSPTSRLSESDDPFSNDHAVSNTSPRSMSIGRGDAAELVDTELAYHASNSIDDVARSKAESSEEAQHKISITAVDDARAATPSDGPEHVASRQLQEVLSEPGPDATEEERRQYHLSVNLSRNSAFLVNFD